MITDTFDFFSIPSCYFQTVITRSQLTKHTNDGEDRGRHCSEDRGWSGVVDVLLGDLQVRHVQILGMIVLVGHDGMEESSDHDHRRFIFCPKSPLGFTVKVYERAVLSEVSR